MKRGLKILFTLSLLFQALFCFSQSQANWPALSTSTASAQSNVLKGVVGTGGYSYIDCTPNSPYVPEAVAYFNQLTGTVPTAWKVSVNSFIVALKSSGNWILIDRLYIHATPNQQNARINLISPTTGTITETGSVLVWTANLGYAYNGGYLNYNFTPSTQGVNYTQNSNSFGAYGVSNVGINAGAWMGASVSGANITALYPAYTGSVALYASNQAGYTTPSRSINRNFYTVSRTGANATSLNYAGASVGTATTVSTSLPNVSFFGLVANLAGGPVDPCGQTLSLSFMGSGLINQASLYIDVQALMAGIGCSIAP